MAHVKKQKKGDNKKIFAKINPHMKDFGSDPFFLKKAEKARDFLKKNGVPPGFPPFEG
jgi:hypothetical protein